MGYTGDPSSAPRIEGSPFSAELSYGQDGARFTEFTVVITPPVRLSKNFLQIHGGLGQDGFTEFTEMASTPDLTYFEGHVELSPEDEAEGIDGVKVGLGMVQNIVNRLNAISNGDLSN